MRRIRRVSREIYLHRSRSVGGAKNRSDVVCAADIVADNLAVVCHNIRSAYNVGSVFRTADGAGAVKIYLTGYTPDPPHPGISKTALGAEKIVAWEKFAKLDTAISKLK